MLVSISRLASAPDKLKNTRPSWSIVTIITFSGINLSLILEGVFTVTGSLARNEAANIKNVTSKNAKSTIGVMSMDGELLGIFNLGIACSFKC